MQDAVPPYPPDQFVTIQARQADVDDGGIVLRQFQRRLGRFDGRHVIYRQAGLFQPLADAVGDHRIAFN